MSLQAVEPGPLLGHVASKAWCYLQERQHRVNIDQLLQTVASQRNLRQSTVYVYQGFIKRLGIEDDS